MKANLKNASLFLCMITGLSLPAVSNARFWEIPDPDLKYIAMVRADPSWGSAVIYNPVFCEEIGKACGFFRDHAYAHAQLNHNLLPPPSYAFGETLKADCWAAKNGKPDEIYAATQLILNYDGNKSWKIHGDPVQRAEHIRTCALQAGNWIGN